MAGKKSKESLVWIDMEMTGLDPLKEGIIEIATVITDSELNVVAEGPNLVVKQSEKLLNGMDSWNKKSFGTLAGQHRDNSKNTGQCKSYGQKRN